MSRHRLKFELLSEKFTICRLPADAAIPAWAVRGMLNSITRTTDELSIICREASVPADVNAERGWKCLKLNGPISFSETGVLTAFLQPLSDHAIPIFVLSTHDTDYVLVKEAWLTKALQCLRDAGHDDGTTPGAN